MFFLFSLIVFASVCSYTQAQTLMAQLKARESEILDFSMRLYCVQNEAFVAHPSSQNDRKSRRDATLVGAYWMDIYARMASEDYLDGMGETKNRNGLVVVDQKMMKMMEEEEERDGYGASPIGTYLHDVKDVSSGVDMDRGLFFNDRLHSDDEVSNRLL
jgi:hypothetical protein